MENTKLEISNMLKDLGISPALKGYGYLKTAIELTIEDESLVHHITKELYPAIAKKHKTLPNRVERGMRHAIEKAWDIGDIDKINSIFGYTVDARRGKPTNSEFIATVADYLLLMQE